jgi:acetoin utilization protein AcuB
MLVQDVMRAEVITIAPHTTLPEAIRLARERGVRHLPVVEDGRLVGIVSDRDLKRAMASPATSLAKQELTFLLNRLQVREIMTPHVVTTAPMLPVEDAARVLLSEKISALPVTEGDRLVGIVSETDLLGLLVKGLGATEPSSRLDVVLDDRRSALTDLLRALEEAGATVSSVMTLVNAAGLREAVVRIATINPGPVVQALRARGFTVRDAQPR